MLHGRCLSHCIWMSRCLGCLCKYCMPWRFLLILKAVLVVQQSQDLCLRSPKADVMIQHLQKADRGLLILSCCLSFSTALQAPTHGGRLLKYMLNIPSFAALTRGNTGCGSSCRKHIMTLPWAVRCVMAGWWMQGSPWHHTLGRASPRPLADRLRSEGAPGTSHDRLGGSCHHRG